MPEKLDTLVATLIYHIGSIVLSGNKYQAAGELKGLVGFAAGIVDHLDKDDAQRVYVAFDEKLRELAASDPVEFGYIRGYGWVVSMRRTFSERMNAFATQAAAEEDRHKRRTAAALRLGRRRA